MSVDLNAVIIASIGLLGVLSGHFVSRQGKRAEAQQKALADRAAHEHKLFEERGEIIEDLRVQADRADARADRAAVEADRCQEEARLLREDLIDLSKVVRDEIARASALTEAHFEREDLLRNRGGARRIRPDDV